MGDTIYRQAAIDRIQGTGYADAIKNNLMLILRLLPSAQPEPRWIPCGERLPDIGADGYTDKVLVSFDHYSGVEICEYRITDGVGRWYVGDTDDSPEDIGLQVTAWMPLPEPYRGDAE